MAHRSTAMDPVINKRLGVVQSAAVLAAAFLVLGWLYVMLIGVRPPR